MLEPIVEFLSSVPWYWVLVIAFLITLIENIFPPSPSDTVLVFTGSLVPIGTVGFPELLIFATLGSTLGFIIMYSIGAKFDSKILKTNKIPYIKIESVEKVENWFAIYGYKLIVANRFLAGTRAVISFFAGMAHLKFKKTIILSAISSAIWNSILIMLGMFFGANWLEIQRYLQLYGYIISPVVVAVILFFVVRWLIIKNKKNQNNK